MKMIRNNRKGIFDACGLKLMPGLNPLDDEDKVNQWNEAKKTEAIQNLLEPTDDFPGAMLQEITFSSDSDKKRVRGDAVIDFSKLKRQEKKETAREIFDISILEKWLDKEKDGQVKKVIKEQIKKITPDVKDED